MSIRVWIGRVESRWNGTSDQLYGQSLLYIRYKKEYFKFIHLLTIKIINIMDKKELMFYVTPEVELVDVELDAQLLAGSAETDPFDGSTEGPEEQE